MSETVPHPLVEQLFETIPEDVEVGGSRFRVNRVDHPEVNLRKIGPSSLSRSTGAQHANNSDQLPSFEAGSLQNSRHSTPRGSITGRLEHVVRSSFRSGKNLFRQMTQEALPRIDNYKQFAVNRPSRPTLEELHENTVDEKTPQNPEAENGEPEEEKLLFGWIEGALVRNCLNIWGVMLFLRMSWVVGQAGIGYTLIIIAMSTFITMVTALSISAIATNGEIGGGGTYYLMARSIGPEFGGSVGVIFAVANAINVALNIVGFAQTLQDCMKNYFNGAIIVDGGDNDTRILGSILMLVTAGLCQAGMKYEMKTQLVLLAILAIALVNFFVGSFIGHTNDVQLARGYLAYDNSVFKQNWGPQYSTVNGVAQDFFSVFSVFFPACIGILAGANVSGDLRNPNEAIPKGTIWSVIITSLTYAIVGVMCGGVMVRNASGDVNEINNKTALNSSAFECSTRNCTYGLVNDYQAMTLISAYGPINYAGCFASTLSTALASYVSAPKLLQVIGDDKLYPYLDWFAKPYGKSKEALRLYAVSYIICMVFILIVQLDVIAMLITNLFLVTFALINFCTFHVDVVKPVSWRPTFRYYNAWLSLVCAIACIVLMFMASWQTAIATIALVFVLYLVVWYRKPVLNWGSTSQAQYYKTALNSVQVYNNMEEHVKNYFPQLLVLSGSPGDRPSLVDFGFLICKKNSLMVCGDVRPEQLTERARRLEIKKANRYFLINKIKAFYCLVDGMEAKTATSFLAKAVGIGKLRPNVLLLGFKQNWKLCSREDVTEYFGIIHAAFENHLAVTILRVPEGLDYSSVLGDWEDYGSQISSLNQASVTSNVSTGPADVYMTINTLTVPAVEGNKKWKMKKDKIILRDPLGNELSKQVIDNVSRFTLKQKKSTIDVWWLYDDGGLTLLLPHIISRRSNWLSTKLRIFCRAEDHSQLEFEHQNMVALLEKFRIAYSEVIVVSDTTRPPDAHTQKWFDTLVKDFTKKDSSGPYISEAELIAMKEKTQRTLRLRELLLEHSVNASLVVMTLPMPRKGAVTGPLYLAWLDALTAGMPPFMLVRGNQTSVLTHTF